MDCSLSAEKRVVVVVAVAADCCCCFGVLVGRRGWGGGRWIPVLVQKKTSFVVVLGVGERGLDGWGGGRLDSSLSAEKNEFGGRVMTFLNVYTVSELVRRLVVRNMTSQFRISGTQLGAILSSNSNQCVGCGGRKERGERQMSQCEIRET